MSLALWSLLLNHSRRLVVLRATFIMHKLAGSHRLRLFYWMRCDLTFIFDFFLFWMWRVRNMR